MANLRSNSLILNPRDLQPARREGEPITPTALARDLRSLRAELRGLQEALRRLQASQAMQQAEREQWARDVQAVSEDAVDRGMSMAVGFLGDGVGRFLERRSTQVQGQLSRALTQLYGEASRDRRTQLHTVVAMLDRRRSEVRRAIRLTREASVHGEQAERVFDTAEWALTPSDDVMKSLQGVRMVGELCLNDPGVQRTLRLSGFPAKFLELGNSIVESGLAITTVAFGMARIAQMNENSDRYLFDVANLASRIQQVLNQISRLETAMNSGSQPLPEARRERGQ